MTDAQDRTRICFPQPAEPGELTFSGNGCRVTGASAAALASAFAIDSWKVAVDMGRCSRILAAQETVLITHCHSDHVAGLVAWLSAHVRRHEGAVTRIVVPSPRREPLLRALEIWPDLDGLRRRIDLSQTLRGADAGDRVELASGGWAESFAVHHSTPSLGWRIGAEGRARPELVFAGDGTVLPFQRDPKLLDARLALVECSFVEPGTRVAARLGGHSHLQDWLELLPRLTCDALALIHLPVDATAERVLELIGAGSGAGPTIVPWLPPPRETRTAAPGSQR